MARTVRLIVHGPAIVRMDVFSYFRIYRRHWPPDTPTPARLHTFV